mmetsp:Transcript_10157/g.14888  ORF Transcript_10157/g.14888 Transcript_10157/m.14888 type:complete len:250 (+) Transcript_10157:85-834(+)
MKTAKNIVDKTVEEREQETIIEKGIKIDENISEWIHNTCSSKGIKSKKTLPLKMVTILWKILSISNNGAVWLLLSPMLVLLSYYFYPHHLHADTRQTMDTTTTIPLILSIYHIFAIEMYKLRFLGTVFTFDLVFIGLMKLFINRQRPHYTLRKKGEPRGNHSFPSGHSTRAAILLGLWIYDKTGTTTTMDWILRSIIVFGWTVLMGLSRVALGRHHLFDVIMGYIIGFAELGSFLAIRPYFPQFFAPLE